MKYTDLRDFISQLQQKGELKRVSHPVSSHLEMTEIADRTLRAEGPALLFEQVDKKNIPVLANLFGTPHRVALGMGADSISELRRIGHLLARLKEPEPPKGIKDVLDLGGLVKSLWDMAPKERGSAPCQDVVWEGSDVDLSRLPIQHCWPRHRAAHHLGPGHHQGSEQEAPEPGHLSPAGAGSEQGHHALAGPSRRRTGLP